MATATNLRVMLLDRPGLAHDALAAVLDDVEGVVRLLPGRDHDDTVPPDVSSSTTASCNRGAPWPW